MPVAPLEGTADDEVGPLPGEQGEGLVEIEVIAGEERETQAVDFDDLRRALLVGVRGVQPEQVPFERRQMPLAVLPGDLPVPAERPGRVVPVPTFRAVEGVEEDDGPVFPRRIPAGVIEPREEAFVRREQGLPVLRRRPA